jgi:hypothetical protein
LERRCVQATNGFDLHVVVQIGPLSDHKIDTTAIDFSRVDIEAVHRELHFHEVLGVPAYLKVIETFQSYSFMGSPGKTGYITREWKGTGRNQLFVFGSQLVIT